MKRREFIKISSLGFGAMAIIEPLFGKIEDLVKSGKIVLSRIPTYCEVCFWKCAGWIYLNDKKDVWKVVGNDEDPNCNGRLCPRGTGGVGMYYDEDRLKKPLIRTGEKGKQTFREASWDEALDYITRKMKNISAKYGSESMALFHHGSGGKYFSTLMKAYGSDNIAKPSFAQCMGPREVAFATTFGSGLGSPEPTDIRDTKCLVLIGSHIGENMHNGQIQEMSDAIDKGATIITVDPRCSTAAGKSKFWLPIKPATDIALMLAWMHELIYNEWYDKNYVEKYTYGFAELKEHVKNYTPEWAYGITTLTPESIRLTAKEMANASPAVIIHPGRHTTWYGDDTQRLRCVAILNALLGSWGRRGGFYTPVKPPSPHFHLPEFPKPKWTWKDTVPGKYNLVSLGLANIICDASLPETKKENQIKGWIVAGTNLISTLPDKKKTLKAIQNLELLVAIDTMPMEITGWADVVLPECTYFERYDSLRADQHREPNISLRMPAVEPKYDTKSAWWMAKTLGEKLGLGTYFPFKTQEEELDWELKQMGSSLEEMQKIGVKKFERKTDDLYFTEGQDISFATDSGKIELYSKSLETEGFDPLPKYTAHKEPPEGFYHLIYGRAPMHTFARTANNPNLNELMKENCIWINPIIAKIWNLSNEQKIWLKNQDEIVSTFPIKVRVTERIGLNSIYMVHGFGHTDARLSKSVGRGASVSDLITKVMIDPIMGGTGMRGNFVTFLTEKPELEVKV